MLTIFSFNCNNFSHSELYNTFFNSIKEILLVEMLSTEFLVNIITWPAALEIHRIKASFCIKKVQLPQDWFGAPTWPPFHYFRTMTCGQVNSCASTTSWQTLLMEESNFLENVEKQMRKSRVKSPVVRNSRG